MRIETVIVQFFQPSRHSRFGNKEYPVEVQPLLLRRPLPRTHISPFPAAGKVSQASAQLCPKRLFRVFAVVEGESSGGLAVISV